MICLFSAKSAASRFTIVRLAIRWLTVAVRGMIDVPRFGRCRRRPVFDKRLLAEFDDRPVGKHRLDTFHVIARRSDAHRMRAGRVDTHHSANRRDRRIRRIGWKVSSVRPQNAVELIADDARLHANRRIADRLDGPHPAGKVDDDSLADCRSGDAGSGSAGDQRQAGLRRIAGERHDVVPVVRSSHRERRYLENARVAGVHGQRQRIAPQLAFEAAGEIFDQSLLPVVHVCLSLRCEEIMRTVDHAAAAESDSPQQCRAIPHRRTPGRSDVSAVGPDGRFDSRGVPPGRHQTEAFLAIALAHFEIEGGLRGRFESAVPCSAAVTDQDVFHEEE